MEQSNYQKESISFLVSNGVEGYMEKDRYKHE